MMRMVNRPSKTIGNKTYIHVDYAELLDAEAQARLADAEGLAEIQRGDQYNIIRFDPGFSRFSLLNYPEFFESPFPALRETWTVDIGNGKLGYRTYEDSFNPPILHRKELLLPEDHPRRAEYADLTKAAESIGLFDEPTRIGFQGQWLRLVQEKGYRIAGHQLVPIGNDESEQSDTSAIGATTEVARHLTALVRYGFSAPIQTLARYGFLDGSYSIFDYGCGRGDDVRGLTENGLQVAGWDPHYAPDNPATPAHIVNLGFVINVIEDFDERVHAIHRAFSLAERFLVVSVMLENQNVANGQRHNDGVLTRRGTFRSITPSQN